VSVISGDMLDPASLDRALDGFDTVVHPAATAGVSSYTESLRTLQVNILGTASLPERAADRGMERFVRVSTSEAFGPDALCVSEAW